METICAFQAKHSNTFTILYGSLILFYIQLNLPLRVRRVDYAVYFQEYLH